MHQKVKGMLDYIGTEAEKLRYVEKSITNEIKKYGFTEIITPILEYTDVFTHNIGEETDIVAKEMYTFTDKAKRSLSLRPEGTTPVVRSYVENKLYGTEPLVKLYYFGPMFRYDRPQAGRYRQFYQFGVEAIGAESYLIDSDIIYSGRRIFQILGLNDIVLKINTIGDFSSREKYARLLQEYFGPHKEELCPDCRRRLLDNPLRILDCKVDRNNPLLFAVPDIHDALTAEAKDYFRNVLKMLDALNVSYEIDNSLVRGLDYYTGVVFEFVYDGPGKNKGLALGGGGGYRNLIADLGGPNIPGSGYAFGLERIIMFMDEQNLFAGLEKPTDVVLIALDDESKEHTLYLSNILRNAGYAAQIDYYNTGLKPQFRFADRTRAKYIIIVGGDERSAKTVTVKSTADRGQEVIKEEKLLEYLKERKNENSIQ